MTAEMSEDYNERTSITAWRWGVGSSGCLSVAGPCRSLSACFRECCRSGRFPGGDHHPDPAVLAACDHWRPDDAQCARALVEHVPAVWAQARAVFGTRSFRLLPGPTFCRCHP